MVSEVQSGKGASQAKVIVKYSLLTFVSLTLLLVLTFSSLSIFTPVTLGNMFYDLGFEKLSLNFYEKQFEKTNKIDDLHKVLIVANVAGNNESFIKFFNEFESFENVNDYYELHDAQVLNKNISARQKSYLLNEKNFLTQRYVLALIKTGKVAQSQSVALNTWDYDNFDLENLGVFALGTLLQQQEISSAEHANFLSVGLSGKEVQERLVEYFNGLHYLFNAAVQEPLTNTTLVRVLALSHRLANVAQSVVLTNSFVQTSMSNAQVYALMENVLTQTSVLLAE